MSGGGGWIRTIKEKSTLLISPVCAVCGVNTKTVDGVAFYCSRCGMAWCPSCRHGNYYSQPLHANVCKQTPNSNW